MITNGIKLWKLVKVEQIITQSELYDGTYPGIQGGYIVTFKIGEHSYELETDIGVKGINIPCTVHIDKGDITITN